MGLLQTFSVLLFVTTVRGEVPAWPPQVEGLKIEPSLEPIDLLSPNQISVKCTALSSELVAGSNLISLTLSKWNTDTNAFDNLYLINALKSDKVESVKDLPNAKVSGAIVKGGDSHLSLSLRSQNAAEIEGTYGCVALVLDTRGGTKTLEVALPVKKQTLDLSSLSKFMTEISSEIEQLESIVNKQQLTIDSLKAAADTIESEIKALNIPIKPIDQLGVNASLKLLEVRLDTVDIELSNVKKTLPLNNTLVSLENGVQAFNASLDQLEARINSAVTSAETVNQTIISNNQALDKAQAPLDLLTKDREMIERAVSLISFDTTIRDVDSYIHFILTSKRKHTQLTDAQKECTIIGGRLLEEKAYSAELASLNMQRIGVENKRYWYGWRKESDTWRYMSDGVSLSYVPWGDDEYLSEDCVVFNPIDGHDKKFHPISCNKGTAYNAMCSVEERYY